MEFKDDPLAFLLAIIVEMANREESMRALIGPAAAGERPCVRLQHGTGNYSGLEK
jgi:hypothetical protein